MKLATVSVVFLLMMLAMDANVTANFYGKRGKNSPRDLETVLSNRSKFQIKRLEQEHVRQQQDPKDVPQEVQQKVQQQEVQQLFGDIFRMLYQLEELIGMQNEQTRSKTQTRSNQDESPLI